MKKTNIIILIIFLLLACLVGINHEPWVDEAQSWIIARDASVFEIIWELARYEGTFPLWHLTLKGFITLGLTYDYIFIIPIIISTIGLIVFLKKVEGPKYVKILFPFTYYTFFQYTIIARNYCFLLLAISLLLATYKKKIDKPIKYIMALLFLSLISIHGMIVSLILATCFIVELFKEKKLKKSINIFIIFGIVIIGEIIVLFPPSDLYMTVAAVYTIPQIIIGIINALLGNGNLFFKIYNIISILLTLIAFSKLFILKNKDILIAICVLFVFMFAVRFYSHHAGIIYFLIIFGIISNYEEIKSKTKNFDKLLVSSLILYCVLSIQCSVNDIYYNYSGSKQMAEYIKNNNYEEKEIAGFGFKAVALQPYFEKNLYYNFEDTIYRWKKSNKDFFIYCNFENYDKTEFSEKPEYIVLEWDDSDSKIKLIQQYILQSNIYEIEYKTEGNVFFKNSYCEREGYVLYKLKNNT